MSTMNQPLLYINDLVTGGLSEAFVRTFCISTHATAERFTVMLVTMLRVTTLSVETDFWKHGCICHPMQRVWHTQSDLAGRM